MIKIKNKLNFFLMTMISGLILISLTLYLVLYDEGFDESFSPASNKCIEKMVYNTAVCKPSIFSLSELNSIISCLTDNKIRVVAINNSDSVKLYMPFTYNQIHTGVTSNAMAVLQNDVLHVQLSNTKIGKLPVSSKIILSLVKQHLPENVVVAEDKILIPVGFNYKFNNNDVSIKFSEFSILDDSVLVKTVGSINGLSLKDGINKLVNNFFNMLQ